MASVLIRWGDGRRADSDFAREHILDAALRCYQRNGIEKTRMEHIAREAKISRTTIYRYFENREDVVVRIILRELHRLLDLACKRVKKTDSFATFIVETIIAITAISNSAASSSLIKGSSLLLVHTNSNPDLIFSIIKNHFRPHFEKAHAAGELCRGIDLDTFTHWIMHTTFNYILHYDAHHFRQLLWQFLVPSITNDALASCATSAEPSNSSQNQRADGI